MHFQRFLCQVSQQQRIQALMLYKQALRKGNSLEYTDKSFYRKFVRRELEKGVNLTSKEDINRALKKAQHFLDTGLGGLI